MQCPLFIEETTILAVTLAVNQMLSKTAPPNSDPPQPAQLPDQLSCRISGVASFGKDASAVPMVFLAQVDRNALVTIRQVRFLRRKSLC